jgi:outer membrane protein assembly factor BamA
MRELILISLIPVLVSGAELEVIGNDYVSTGEIMAAAGSATEPDAAAVERLYDSYGFLDAEIEFQPDAGALVVTEGPMYRLAAVSVAGELPYTANEVKDKLGLDRGDPLSILALERGVKTILDDLRDEGYLEAELEYSVDKNPAGTADLNIDFSAGEKYAVGEIEFFGVGAFVEGELRRRMETREGTRFSEARLGADILTIIDLYRENGYPEARVVPGRFVLLKDVL